MTVLMNNDCRIIGPTLLIMLDKMLNYGYGIIGPKLIYADERIQHGGVFFQPLSPEEQQRQGIPGYFDHWHRFHPRYFPSAVAERPGCLVTGGFMGIHRGVFMSIGLLDERFGMAAEDIDFQLMAIAAGFTIGYIGYAEAWHLEGQTRGATLEDKAQHPEWTEREKRGLQFLFDKWLGIDWGQFTQQGQIQAMQAKMRK